MKDRIPTYPGRVKLTQVSGNIYDMERADQPSEAGTPINKATLLKDATAALFGLTSAAVPDDILAAIASGRAKIESGTYSGTGVYGSGNANSITFGFTPMLVIIRTTGTSNYNQMVAPYIYGNTEFLVGTGTTATQWRRQVASVSGNTMTWYSDGGNAASQLNASGKTYYWTAIG